MDPRAAANTTRQTARSKDLVTRAERNRMVVAVREYHEVNRKAMPAKSRVMQVEPPGGAKTDDRYLFGSLPGRGFPWSVAHVLDNFEMILVAADL